MSNRRSRNTIWLCNIRSEDGTHYQGREVTDDDAGTHRDGPIYNLRDGAFERLRDAGLIVPMDLAPLWYEGVAIPMNEVIDD